MNDLVEYNRLHPIPDEISESDETIDVQRGRFLLQHITAYYLDLGWKIKSKTKDDVCLIKPKNITVLMFLGLFVFTVPTFIYIVYVFFKKDNLVFLEIVDKGNIKRVDEQGQVAIIEDLGQFKYLIDVSHQSNAKGAIIFFVLGVITLIACFAGFLFITQK